MKLYNALIKKNDSGKIEEIVLLKEGFLWKAFFFSGLWFLYHRMWREVIALFIINTAFLSLASVWPAFDLKLVEIAFATIIAFNANYWRVQNLLSKKYELAGIVLGHDLDDARAHFIEKFKKGCSYDLVEFDDAILNPQL